MSDRRKLIRSTACAVGALMAGLSVGAPLAHAAGPLVPGELRLGESPSSPLVSRLFGPFSDPWDFAIRSVTLTRFEATDGSSVACPDFNGKGDLLAGNPTSELSWFWNSGPCSSTIPGVPQAWLIEAGTARVRYQQGRVGGIRDGVVEPQHKVAGFGSFLVRLSVTEPGPPGQVHIAVCPYRLEPTARLDVYNPGHGHKIVLDHEALRIAPPDPHDDLPTAQHCPGDDGDPATVDATLTADMRLRFSSDGETFAQPAWLHPVAPAHDA